MSSIDPNANSNILQGLEKGYRLGVSKDEKQFVPVKQNWLGRFMAWKNGVSTSPDKVFAALKKHANQPTVSTKQRTEIYDKLKQRIGKFKGRTSRFRSGKRVKNIFDNFTKSISKLQGEVETSVTKRENLAIKEKVQRLAQANDKPAADFFEVQNRVELYGDPEGHYTVSDEQSIQLSFTRGKVDEMLKQAKLVSIGLPPVTPEDMSLEKANQILETWEKAGVFVQLKETLETEQDTLTGNTVPPPPVESSNDTTLKLAIETRMRELGTDTRFADFLEVEVGYEEGVHDKQIFRTHILSDEADKRFIEAKMISLGLAEPTDKMDREQAKKTVAQFQKGGFFVQLQSTDYDI